MNKLQLGIAGKPRAADKYANQPALQKKVDSGGA